MCRINMFGFKDCSSLKMDSNEFSVNKSLSKGGFIINERNLTNISSILTTKKLIPNVFKNMWDMILKKGVLYQM